MTTTPVMTINDEQIADIEFYCTIKRGEGFEIAHNIGLSEIIAIISRLRAAEKDAERYRWLRDGNAYFPEEEMIRGGDDLDSAIDAAMEQSK